MKIKTLLCDRCVTRMRKTRDRIQSIEKVDEKTATEKAILIEMRPACRDCKHEPYVEN